jgi:NTE family protein
MIDLVKGLKKRSGQTPTIGLALGGGGVRGLAHLGVLTVFEREAIPVHAIAGSSMGAIVGAAYALNPKLSAEELTREMTDVGLSLPVKLNKPQGNNDSFLERLRQFIGVERFLVDTLWGWGVMPETVATEALAKLTRGKNLEDGKIPVAAVAVDLLSGEKIVFETGPAAIALQASSAIPGFFPPVPYGERLLADGAIVDFVPADVVRGMGVDVVIAVDVDQEGERAEVRNGLEAFLRAVELCSRHHKRHHLESADLVIHPEFGEPVKTFEVAKAPLCIEAGARAAENSLPAIRRLLEGHDFVAPVPTGAEGPV